MFGWFSSLGIIYFNMNEEMHACALFVHVCAVYIIVLYSPLTMSKLASHTCICSSFASLAPFFSGNVEMHSIFN